MTTIIRTPSTIQKPNQTSIEGSREVSLLLLYLVLDSVRAVEFFKLPSATTFDICRSHAAAVIIATKSIHIGLQKEKKMVQMKHSI